MIELATILPSNAVFVRACADSKKQLLQLAAKRAEEVYGLPAKTVLEVLSQRERDGSTGIGQGIAIPHGKLSELDRVVGLFLRLKTPIDFDATDDQRVDLVCVLLAPSGTGSDHLKALSRIARTLRDDDTVAALRQASDIETLHACLIRLETEKRAA